MSTAQMLLIGFQIFLAFANSCILVVAFVKFLGKPHTTLEQRITALEVRVKELEEKDNDQTDRFEKIEKALNVLIHSSLSLIEFEMQYCLIEDKEMSDGLKESKKALHDFLAEK